MHLVYFAIKRFNNEPCGFGRANEIIFAVGIATAFRKFTRLGDNHSFIVSSLSF